MRFRFGLAVLLPLLALGLQWLLWPWLSPLAWFLFFPAVFFSARLGGFRGGLISTGLSTVIVWYCFIPLQYSWRMSAPSDFLSVGMFLLVEDNPRDVDLTPRALKKHHLANHVRVVRDGQEALDFLFPEGNHDGRILKQSPRRVLLDLKLPKVNGFEVSRRVKSDEKTRAIPVVVLTCSREEKDMIESYRLGVNSYIQKPVDFDKFLDCVQELGLYWLLINQMP